jgi:hypothetical protein
MYGSGAIGSLCLWPVLLIKELKVGKIFLLVCEMD